MLSQSSIDGAKPDQQHAPTPGKRSVHVYDLKAKPIAPPFEIVFVAGTYDI